MSNGVSFKQCSSHTLHERARATNEERTTVPASSTLLYATSTTIQYSLEERSTQSQESNISRSVYGHSSLSSWQSYATVGDTCTSLRAENGIRERLYIPHTHTHKHHDELTHESHVDIIKTAGEPTLLLLRINGITCRRWHLWGGVAWLQSGVMQKEKEWHLPVTLVFAYTLLTFNPTVLASQRNRETRSAFTRSRFSSASASSTPVSGPMWIGGWTLRPSTRTMFVSFQDYSKSGNNRWQC